MLKLVVFVLFLFIIFFYRSLPAFASDVKIGLIYSKEQGQKLLDGDDTLKYYRQAIELNGGRVVVLSQNYDDEFLNVQLGQLQGLLVPGGIDVDPKSYNEEMNGTGDDADYSFDQFEFRIIKYCVEKKIPIMGICRGYQLLNVYFGGTLIQDIPRQYEREDKLVHQVLKEDGNVKAIFHYMTIKKKSLLYEILGEEKMRINSTHHQAVKKLAPGFEITAVAPDGIPEGIENTNGMFIYGVQFHPERLVLEDPRFDKLFERLIMEASKTLNYKPSTINNSPEGR